ncbi:hypothetical protein BKA62DRAFT_190367 [Auriculariales sp. MPI-PUGE-AT-0066]|nr:hypothetical protein BKA62DRAFT_190367 [Auriculariales sp. MPI-PUGE-AT-0066]
MANLINQFERNALEGVASGIIERIASEKTVQSSAYTLNDVAETIFSLTRRAVAQVLRKLNHSLPQSRLPAELWLQVWSLLGFSDRVTTSHVCHSWREAIIGFPQLWTSIRFISTVHGEDCTCGPCISVDQPCVTCQRPPKKRTENFEKAFCLLERGAGVPVDLRIAIDAPDFTLLPAWRQLRRALQLHSSRIRFLEIEARDMLAASIIIKLLHGSVALQVLHVLLLRGQTWGEDDLMASNHLEADVVLPHLHTLSLAAGVNLASSALPLCPSCNTVRTTFNTTVDILAILKAAPKVQNLHLWYNRNQVFLPGRPEEISALREAVVAAGTQSLVLRHTAPWIIQAFLATFDLKKLASVIVEQFRSDEPQDETFSSVLSSLARPDNLAWLMNDTSKISVSREEIQLREVTFTKFSRNRASSFRLWDRLDPGARDTLHSIHVDYRAWHGVFLPEDDSYVWNIERLTIDVSRNRITSDIVEWANIGPMRAGAFPQLRRLCLRAKPSKQPPELLQSVFRRATVNLGIQGQRLQTLTLEGMVPEGGIDLWLARMPIDELIVISV